MTTNVEFWFDPTCPHTWRTSRWLVDVAERRGLEIEWQLVSLAILNEGKDAPPERLLKRRRSRPVLQALESVRQRHGPRVLGQVYAHVGAALHEQSAEVDVAVVGEALADLGIDDVHLDLQVLDGFQVDVAAQHEHAQRRVGIEIGSPLLAVDGGRAFFGPVLARVPESAEADRIFDGAVALMVSASFSELKGSRS